MQLSLIGILWIIGRRGILKLARIFRVEKSMKRVLLLIFSGDMLIITLMAITIQMALVFRKKRQLLYGATKRVVAMLPRI